MDGSAFGSIFKVLGWTIILVGLVLGVTIGCLGHAAFEWSRSHVVRVESRR